jgi:hypothetical protein
MSEPYSDDLLDTVDLYVEVQQVLLKRLDAGAPARQRNTAAPCRPSQESQHRFLVRQVSPLRDAGANAAPDAGADAALGLGIAVFTGGVGEGVSFVSVMAISTSGELHSESPTEPTRVVRGTGGRTPHLAGLGQAPGRAGSRRQRTAHTMRAHHAA